MYEGDHCPLHHHAFFTHHTDCSLQPFLCPCNVSTCVLPQTGEKGQPDLKPTFAHTHTHKYTHVYSHIQYTHQCLIQNSYHQASCISSSSPCSLAAAPFASPSTFPSSGAPCSSPPYEWIANTARMKQRSNRISSQDQWLP